MSLYIALEFVALKVKPVVAPVSVITVDPSLKLKAPCTPPFKDPTVSFV